MEFICIRNKLIAILFEIIFHIVNENTEYVSGFSLDLTLFDTYFYDIAFV